MKTTPNRAVRALRKTIGRTQAEFAAMIGASKHTVVSWETGRNRLSPAFARRIAFATGVVDECLLKNEAVLLYESPFVRLKPYTAEDFAHHRQTLIGRSDAAAAAHHWKHCADALELLFQAATKSSGGRLRYRLPAVLDSFIQWCEQTREDFRLGALVDEALGKRRFKIAVTQTYGAWRKMAREAVRAAGFKDDRRKAESTVLRLELEVVPGWAPGRSMQAPKPAIMEAVLKGKAEGGRAR